MSPIDAIDISEAFSQRVTVHMNVGQEVIVTTVDKMHICLSEHRDSLTKRHEWLTPLALVMSLGATLITSTFHDLGLPAATWQSLFILMLLACGVWLVQSGLRAWKNRCPDPIGTIIGTIKSTAVAPEEVASHSSSATSQEGTT